MALTTAKVTIEIDRKEAIDAGFSQYGTVELELPDSLSHLSAEQREILNRHLSSTGSPINTMTIPTEMYDDSDGWRTQSVNFPLVFVPNAEIWPEVLSVILAWRVNMDKERQQKIDQLNAIIENRRAARKQREEEENARLEQEDLIALHNTPWYDTSDKSFLSVSLDPQWSNEHPRVHGEKPYRKLTHFPLSYHAQRTPQISTTMAMYKEEQDRKIALNKAQAEHDKASFIKLLKHLDPDSRSRIDEGLMPEDEQLNILRDWLLQEFEIAKGINRYKPLKSRDLAHNDECAYAQCEFSSHKLDQGLSEAEYKRLNEIRETIKLVEEQTKTGAFSESPSLTTKYELRVHMAECASCENQTSRRSCLVTMTLYGHTVSREYAL